MKNKKGKRFGAATFVLLAVLIASFTLSGSQGLSFAEGGGGGRHGDEVDYELDRFGDYIRTVPITQAGINVINGVDYSGQGTVFAGTPVALGQNERFFKDDCLDVHVESGRYVNNGWWVWYTWGDWGTGNNKSNDYYAYRGSTATEYEVQSRTEYKYRLWRDNINPVYKMAYHTEFKKKVLWWYSYETKWSFDGYPTSNGSGWSINNKWTGDEFEKYNGGWATESKYTTDWKTGGAPIDLIAHAKYELYETRTTYRHRSRTMEW
ncbi:MAG: hypothetical protein LBT20_06555, partial [Clostridiales bacterium]|nr:hypothetical protein [Clostridiales bacterium]